MAQGKKKNKQEENQISGRGWGHDLPTEHTPQYLEEFNDLEEFNKKAEERIFKLTDEAIERIAAKAKSIDDLIKHYYNLKREAGLFFKGQKKANGEINTAGLDIKDFDTAYKACEYYFEQERPIQIKEAMGKVTYKLSQCDSDAEKIGYLKKALNDSRNVRNQFSEYDGKGVYNNEAFLIGYNVEINKGDYFNFWPLEKIDYESPDAGMKAGAVVHSVIMGSIHCKIESFIISELSKLGVIESGEVAEVAEVPSVDSPRGKLILLYELGILQKLKDDYSYLSKTDLASLICLIVGIKDDNPKKMKQKVKDLAGDIDPLLYGTKASGKGGYIINKQSVTPVKTALTALGIKINKLPDFE